MSGTSLLYRATVRSAVALLPLAALARPKLRRGLRGREASRREFAAWARTSRDLSRPLVWFHAPSMGEGLQALGVLQRLRQRHPDWQFACTWFSPSAEALAERLPTDIAGYLPFDTAAGVGEILDVLAPNLLVFTKLDLWPELATRAAARAIPVAMIAATVRPGSRRLRPPVRAWLQPGYQALQLAAAVDAADADRLGLLGVPEQRRPVVGDPRFDSVVENVRSVRPDNPLLGYGAGAPTLVAGSTWPGDESVLLDAFARLHVHRPEARLILVPHEPTPEHLATIEDATTRRGLPAPQRLSQRSTPATLLLVDRVGLLATLYGAGTMAYVGGGFHSAGLHSVLEPAAWGIPVLFGPRWTESRDAGLLLQAGGAESISELGITEAAEALHAVWDDWIGNEVRRAAQGRKARAVVEAHLGAADRCAALLEGLLIGERSEVRGQR